jgi:hypothetical protein
MSIRSELLGIGYESVGKASCSKCGQEVEVLQKENRKQYFNLDGFMHEFSCGDDPKDLGPRETGSEKDPFSNVKW